MIFLIILILIVALALPSINQNIRNFLYARISSIILISIGALSAFYIQSIGSDTGVYSGLFQIPSVFLDSIFKLRNYVVINFSFSFLFKFIYLFILIILTVYLLRTEYTYVNKINLKNDSVFKQSLNIINKIFKDLLVYFSVGNIYIQFWVNKFTFPLFFYPPYASRHSRGRDACWGSTTNTVDGGEEVKKKKELKSEIDDKISKSSFVLTDFDFKKFIGSLNQEELLALSGLLLNSLVLNYSLSIILILYGEYLIKRFNLEDRYPRLAKFIKLRRTLQNYYLKICFVWIFIGILPQIFIYISILYPKLIELFIS